MDSFCAHKPALAGMTNVEITHTYSCTLHPQRDNKKYTQFHAGTILCSRRLYKAQNFALMDHITIPHLWRQYKGHHNNTATQLHAYEDNTGLEVYR